MGIEFEQEDLVIVKGKKSFLGLGGLRVTDDEQNEFYCPEITFQVNQLWNQPRAGHMGIPATNVKQVLGYIVEPPQYSGKSVAFEVDDQRLVKMEGNK